MRLMFRLLFFSSLSHARRRPASAVGVVGFRAAMSGRKPKGQRIGGHSASFGKGGRSPASRASSASSSHNAGQASHLDDPAAPAAQSMATKTLFIFSHLIVSHTRRRTLSLSLSLSLS